MAETTRKANKTKRDPSTHQLPICFLCSNGGGGTELKMACRLMIVLERLNVETEDDMVSREDTCTADNTK